MKTPWINYLLEFKKRLIVSIVVFFILFILFFCCYKPVFFYSVLPLLQHLPLNGKIVVTTVMAPFVVPIQISFFFAVIVGMPFYLYQLWKFIQPALYPNERFFLLIVMMLSGSLFYMGLLCAYFIFLPLAFKFLVAMTPHTIQIMTDISNYLNFVIKFTLSFGLSFQIPIIVLLCIRTGLVTTDDLVKKRGYVIIAAFILGMLLTPPDVLSQVLAALPLWGLFELGILLSKVIGKPDSSVQMIEGESE